MVILSYIVCYIGCCYCSSGMLFSSMEREFNYLHSANETRYNAGMSILKGSLLSIFLVFGLMVIFLMTGFAKDGIWKN